MKRITTYFASFILIFLFSACGKHSSFYEIDNTPPSTPSGLTALNGDNRVDLTWDPNYEHDLAGYNIYYSYSFDGKYTLIGSSKDNYFVDYGAHNGTTYYYAVTAYDFNGNESDLSYENINVTPRPEGKNEAISDYRRFPDNGGFSFTSYTTVPYDSKSADFFFENYNDTLFIDVWNDSDIQDMGPTQDIYDIPYAPSEGWSPTKDAIAIPGHTYVIWTWDNHYAKIRVNSLTRDRMVFDWAFQTVNGNVDLKQHASNGERTQMQKTNSLKR